MKVLVCGSRALTPAGPVFAALDALGLAEGDEIISGGAPGPDTHAFIWATEHRAHLGVNCTVFRPNWKAYGKRAGILRNVAMLDQAPDLVLAFWDGKSRGTGHTITEARKRGIAVEVAA